MEEQVKEQIPAMPRIGDKAPSFDADTTHGKLNFEEWKKDKWAILFSHPADFTPVCTTELSAFAEEKKFFEDHNTKLIGLSIDSVHSHIAWVNNVKEKTGVYLDFPIIADLDTSVAKKYGMLHPGEASTATVRAVFFIDPNDVIRLIMYYPLNVGRNMEEMKRTLVALQTADDNGVALPINWKEGDKVIVPPPKTLEGLEKTESMNGDKTDFYLIKKSL
jgi:peroxiredoxin (alkyl hydroperoxide reductase subunit C)